MPVADFAGGRNWGYDGVCLYAPSRAYGRPDDLRRLVDRAHQLGIDVILDVLYNHLGPEGAYLPAFNHEVLRQPARHPLGTRRESRGPGSAMVRRFILDNARHWVAEYHADGLRLDATHTLVEEANGAIVREIVEQPEPRRPMPCSSMPRIIGTSRRWSRTRRAAAGDSTASGPMTFIMSCAA